MKIIFRYILGIFNAFMFLSILFNKEFWGTWGNILNVAGARALENLLALTPQLILYSAFALVIGYCFSQKLRNKEKYWNAVFLINCIGLVVAIVLAFAGRTTTHYQIGPVIAIIFFVPLLIAVNIVLLLSKLKKQSDIELENVE